MWDSKEYYDFDYTRHQYYYSFPEDHIIFANPQTQKQLLLGLIEKNSEDYSELYLDIDKEKDIENLVKSNM